MYSLMHYATVMQLHQEHLRRTKHQEMLQNIERDLPTHNVGQKAAFWLGTQMVRWGSKLQRINPPPAPKVVVTSKPSR